MCFNFLSAYIFLLFNHICWLNRTDHVLVFSERAVGSSQRALRPGRWSTLFVFQAEDGRSSNNGKTRPLATGPTSWVRATWKTQRGKLRWNLCPPPLHVKNKSTIQNNNHQTSAGRSLHTALHKGHQVYWHPEDLKEWSCGMHITGTPFSQQLRFLANLKTLSFRPLQSAPRKLRWFLLSTLEPPAFAQVLPLYQNVPICSLKFLLSDIIWS